MGGQAGLNPKREKDFVGFLTIEELRPTEKGLGWGRRGYYCLGAFHHCISWIEKRLLWVTWTVLLAVYYQSLGIGLPTNSGRKQKRYTLCMMWIIIVSISWGFSKNLKTFLWSLNYIKYVPQIFSAHVDGFLHILTYVGIRSHQNISRSPKCPCPLLINNFSKGTTSLTSVIID